MSREETLKMLNANLDKWNIDNANRFIIEYLCEKDIKIDKIQFFITELTENPMMQISNSYIKCLKHTIDYFIRKHEINSILKDNKTIIYY